MIQTDRAYVVSRLKELLGWADYIVESLVIDHPYEKGKRVALEDAVGPAELRELRELAWALRRKLDIVLIEAESVAPPAVSGAPPDREGGEAHRRHWS